jgi:hypothetical protein
MTWNVTCIESVKGELTLHKTYKILEIHTEEKLNAYKVENDMGSEEYYSSKFFKLVIENEKIRV